MCHTNPPTEKAQPVSLSQQVLEVPPCSCGLELPGRPLHRWTTQGHQCRAGTARHVHLTADCCCVFPLLFGRSDTAGLESSTGRPALRRPPHEQVPVVQQELTFRRSTVLCTWRHGLGPGSQRPFQSSRWVAIHPAQVSSPTTDSSGSVASCVAYVRKLGDACTEPRPAVETGPTLGPSQRQWLSRFSVCRPECYS